MYSSGWVKSENIYEYIRNRSQFMTKNKSKKFQEAVSQADNEIEKENQKRMNDPHLHSTSTRRSEPANQIQQNNVSMSSEAEATAGDKLSLKTMAIDDLLKTFIDHEVYIRSLFDTRRIISDRLNCGHGYDYLLVLSRLATSEQQKKMYTHITEAFGIQNLFYENLLWTILLPEWLIGVCAMKYRNTKQEIIDKIKIDEQNSFDANNSFGSFFEL